MARTIQRSAELLRATSRRQQLLDIENEERIEDAEALKLTEEQRLSLFHSFRSVKFEWTDLDGFRNVRRRYNSPPRQAQLPDTSPQHGPRSPHSQLTPPNNPVANEQVFAVHAHVDGDDETIRGRSLPSPTNSESQRIIKSARSTSGSTMKGKAGKKFRSPVKGLFPSTSSGAISNSTSTSALATLPVSKATQVPTALTYGRVPLPPLLSNSNSDSVFDLENDDAWEVLEGENDGEAHALPTPMAKKWQFQDPLDIYAEETTYEVPPRAATPTPYSDAPVYIAGAPLAPSSGEGRKRKR
ncbi:hypothetical protein C8R43DRAFT_1232546 [Mycena crocata]|nr:hypothetical protein C8R43DRAFT_1232546 [Mycena crocata]